MALPASEKTLDRIVKGTVVPSNSTIQNEPPASEKNPPRPPYLPADPTSLLPSSPPQIYLNLLILEASLRSQYVTLRARRRQNTFALTLISAWTLVFFYLIWLRPREDGKGIGGSIYWGIELLQKVGFLTGLISGVLFWATKQWDRGVRWPRRWIGVANRGLRGMNVKIVIIRGTWAQEVAGWLSFVFGGGLWGSKTGGSSYHYINLSQEKRNDLDDGRPRHRIVEGGKEFAEEDIAPGGDLIKLILLPKPFTPDFREGWEIYRTDYWGRENERRAELRRKVRNRQREIAREEGGLFWWTGWRGWKRARGVTGRESNVTTGHHHAHHAQQHSRHLSTTSGSLRDRDRRRRTSTVGGPREHSVTGNSRSSSRSTTPTPEVDERERYPSASAARERRWSNSTTGSTASGPSSRTRAKKSPSVNLASGPGPAVAHVARQPSNPSRLSTTSTPSTNNSRPDTPSEAAMWQANKRTASGLSNGSSSLAARDDEAGAFEEMALGGDGGMGAVTMERPGVKRRGSSGREKEGVHAPSA